MPAAAAGGSREPPAGDAEALERATPRQALHAAGLAFRHPATGEPLEFHGPNGPPICVSPCSWWRVSEVVAHPEPLSYLLFYQ